MDRKKRLIAITIMLISVTAGIWLFGPPQWQSSVLPISFRVTLFFAVLLLAFDDVQSMMQRLRGPVGILLGSGLLLAIIYKPSAKAVFPLLIGCIAVLGVIGFIRRHFSGTSRSKQP